MTRSISVAALAALALALTAPGVHAQTKKPAATPAPAPAAKAEAPDGVGKGDKEFNFFADYTDIGVGTFMVLGVGMGKYMTDNIELKLTQQLFVVDIEAGDSTSLSYAPYVSAEYNFRPPGVQNMTAYVGAGFGVDMDLTSGAGGYSQDTIGMFWTPLAGVKYFLDERIAVTYGLSIRMPIAEETCTTPDFFTDEVCADTETTTIQNNIGFSIYY